MQYFSIVLMHLSKRYAIAERVCNWQALMQFASAYLIGWRVFNKLACKLSRLMHWQAFMQYCCIVLMHLIKRYAIASVYAIGERVFK
jgi:hypothetical protein